MLLRAGAGYVRQQSDRGAAKHPRYETVYEKWLVGAFGDSGFMIRADGTDDVSQAKADGNALAALNAERRHRYSGSAGRTSGVGSPQSPDTQGSAQTVDVT